MIKVCHITSAHQKEDVRIFRKECISLAQAGYDVYLVQQGECYEKSGVHLVGFGTLASSRIKRMLQTSRVAYQKALEVDADIYHLHDPELLSYALKLKKKGKKVIFDSHEFYAEQFKHKTYIPRPFRGIVAKLYAIRQTWILNRIDGLIFPCFVNGKNPFEGQRCRMALVNNVPLLEELYDRYDPMAVKWENTVCHIGSLTHNRGITHLIKAAETANCTVCLGGKFESAEYEAQVRALPEFSRVNHLGQLDRQQVLEALQKTPVGIATLLNVGQYNQVGNLPTKVYEYMALAIPSVLSDNPYNRQVVEKYGIGICVDPADTEAIAKAIRYLLDNPEEARRMGENGRRAIKEEFNWSVEEEKLLALYKTILGGAD